MASSSILVIPMILFTLFSTTSYGHNITDILYSNPDYTEYADLLLKTKVSDEINSRQTITVLVLTNDVVSATLKSQPLDTLKTLLSIHVLLDYFDSEKLHNLTKGSVVSTTLYQTSGVATQRNGFVNITDGDKGKVFFTSATPGSKPTSIFTKSVKSVPYNVSVIEISAPIDAPGVLNPPATKGVNITDLLINAGCKRFADLINKENVIQEYNGARTKGLSVFAPSDDAWKKKQGMPDWTKLSENDLKTVLRYHAAPNYFPMATLKVKNDAFITLATIGADKYGIVPEASGDFVLLKTGVDSARVVTTIVDSAPVVVFQIDTVLLPVELFGNKSSVSPSISPAASPPSPSSPSPKPQPGKPPKPEPKTPTPASGPVPVTPSPSTPEPGESPADGPSQGTAPADDQDTGKKKSGSSRGNCGLFVVAMSIVPFLLSLF